MLQFESLANGFYSPNTLSRALASSTDTQNASKGDSGWRGLIGIPWQLQTSSWILSKRGGRTASSTENQIICRQVSKNFIHTEVILQGSSTDYSKAHRSEQFSEARGCSWKSFVTTRQPPSRQSFSILQTATAGCFSSGGSTRKEVCFTEGCLVVFLGDVVLRFWLFGVFNFFFFFVGLETCF